MEINSNLRLIRLPEVKALTGLSRSSIYQKINPKSPYHDKLFPRPVSLASVSRGAVAWVDHEVQNWLRLRIAASRSGLADGFIPGETMAHKEPSAGQVGM